MKQSNDIKNLSAALRSFDVVNVSKNANNPFFKSKYATLDTLIEHSKDRLRELGITVIQGASYNPEGLTIETRLLHESGEWIETETFIPIEKQTPQGAGSAITYGRRYALGAILNIGTDEDDDGNEAGKQPKKDTKPTKTINFDSMGKELDPMTTDEEVKAYFIKLGIHPDRSEWTPEQLKDIADIKAIHLTRVAFKGEKQ